jgi:hypothetical protein
VVIFELEKRFIEDKLIVGHGRLVELTVKTTNDATRRRLRTVYGSSSKAEGEAPVEVPTLDRILARVVDAWLEGRRTERQSAGSGQGAKS